MEKVKISVIIPTLNEVEYLSKTVEHVFQHADYPEGIEILVVDAGSSDRTLESVKESGARTFNKPEFALKKYLSLNFGIKQAQGEILIFLDADTILPVGFDTKVSKALELPNIVGGAFNLVFDYSNLKLWLLQNFNKIRYQMGNIYYGDQAVFCSKHIALKVGGYPENELMESAYFCKKLLKTGKLSLIESPVKTSPRRFLRHGFFNVFWFDFTMWIRFVLHLSVEEYGKKYWGLNMNADG